MNKYRIETDKENEEAVAAKSGWSTFLEGLYSFFSDPIPFKGRNLDSRFKYQYAYDRFKTGAIGNELPVKERGFSSVEIDQPDISLTHSVDELKREKVFGDSVILKLNRECSREEMILFFRLAPNFSTSDLKSAYRHFVRTHHPDFSANLALQRPELYALAQKKVQLANLFKDQLRVAS